MCDLFGCFLLGLCSMVYVGFLGFGGRFSVVLLAWLVSLLIFGAVSWDL